MKSIKIISSLAAFAATCAASASPFFIFNNGNYTITDLSTATASEVVTGLPSTITSVDRVIIRGFKHTWSGDLTAILSNGSVSVSLFVRPGKSGISSPGSSRDFGISTVGPLTGSSYVFQDNGSTTIWHESTLPTTAPLPSIGMVYKPSGAYISGSGTTAVLTSSALSAFAGSNTNGTWTMSITDSASGDTGAFTGFEVTGQAVPEPTTMAALAIGALALKRRRKAA